MSDIYKISQPSFIQSPFTCLTNLSTNPASWPTMNTSHMIETLWNPQKITHIFLALNMFQCILMHPNFQYSSWARITRLCIALISFPWWVCYPFKVVLLPLDQHIFENGTNGANCVMWGMKVIEWGFARGPYLTHRHPSKSTKSKLSNEVKPIMIVKDEHDKKLEGNDYLDWGLTQLTSFRGFRCSWGSVKITPHLNFFETLVSLYQNYLIGLISAISLIAVRDSPDVTPASALTQIGLPPFFYGHSIFARCIHTLSYGLAIKSVIEFINLSFSLISHIIYPIIISLRILPNSICEFFNPIWYPPAFNSIFKSDSLAHFWGKAWHQMFRRGFMICGGIPASRLALHLGLNHQSQRLAGLFGTFAFSGLVHEYSVFILGQHPHPDPYIPFQTFPGPFLFFLVQPIGMIIEPFILPYLPKRIGGGKIWTLGFILLTCPMFSNSIYRKGSNLDLIKPLKYWSWNCIYNPTIIWES